MAGKKGKQGPITIIVPDNCRDWVPFSPGEQEETESNGGGQNTTISFFAIGQKPCQWEDFGNNPKGDAYDALLKHTGKTISDLASDEDGGLLIFPPNLKAGEDRLDKTDDNVYDFGWDKVNPRIKTGNVMGFIGFNNGTQLMIRSRFSNFANGENDGKNNGKNDGLHDWFLQYLLSKVFNFSPAAFKLDFTKGEEGILDFMAFFFVSAFRNAMRQGVYRAYRTFERDDANVRGPIDIPRQISRNTPFAGKIAYHSRERSADNDVTQLIRHTIEFIERRPNLRYLLRDPNVRSDVQEIRNVTPSYSPMALRSVLNANVRPLRTAYFDKYIPLQYICRQILRRKKLSYGMSGKDKIHGILFDGSWLWEQYMYRMIMEAGLDVVHPDNRTGKDPVLPFEHSSIGRFFPDFYARDQRFVLDAKYKRLIDDDSEEGRNPDSQDLQQVIAYMHVLDAKHGGFLFPCPASSESQSDEPHSLGKLKGKGGEMFTIPFYVQQETKGEEFNAYAERMGEAEKAFQKKLKKFAAKASASSWLTVD